MIRRTALLAIAALPSCHAAPLYAAAAGEECELDAAHQVLRRRIARRLALHHPGRRPPRSQLQLRHQGGSRKQTQRLGLQDSYAPTRDVRIELPPGLIGDPNVLGVPQQCTVQELVTYTQPGSGCPNGSQIGRTTVITYELRAVFVEPVYMMQPPGGDVVARLGFIAGVFPTFIDLKLRSEGDYGLTAEISDATANGRLIKADTTTWGVPADHSHDTERCTSKEVFSQNCCRLRTAPTRLRDRCPSSPTRPTAGCRWR